MIKSPSKLVELFSIDENRAFLVNLGSYYPLRLPEAQCASSQTPKDRQRAGNRV